MSNYLTERLRFLFFAVVIAGLQLQSIAAIAWTSAYIERVDVTLDVAQKSFSKVHTLVRYTVEGGKFHGFDVADLQGAAIVADETSAIGDDGRIYALDLRPLGNGKTRISLADNEFIGKGGINFEIVHTLDLVSSGFLRWHNGMARLDWTPLLWDEGLDAMTVNVNIPGQSNDIKPKLDSDICKDFEVEVKDNIINIIKFRPVRWYAMRSVIDFDPKLIPALKPSKETKPEEPVKIASAVNDTEVKRLMPVHIQLLPIIIIVFGVVIALLKLIHVQRVYRYAGQKEAYFCVDSIPLFLRAMLAVGAAGLGFWAQYKGSIAAGVPALAVTSTLLLIRSKRRQISLKSGGRWRRMDEVDTAHFQEFAKAYRRMQGFPIDITSPLGFLSFGLALTGLAFLAIATKREWPSIAWICVIDGLLLVVPAWFSNVRAELPVDPAIESFEVLRKWKKSLGKVIGSKDSASMAEFWVREDEQGPIEVRLRVETPCDGLNGIEIAGETVFHGGIQKTRTAVVLRIEPGTETARRLATCSYAVEHHLTPDLEEEIIVLRNRRGRALGLAPLRAALALL